MKNKFSDILRSLISFCTAGIMHLFWHWPTGRVKPFFFSLHFLSLLPSFFFFLLLPPLPYPVPECDGGRGLLNGEFEVGGGGHAGGVSQDAGQAGQKRDFPLNLAV